MNKDFCEKEIFRTVNLRKFYPQTKTFALQDISLKIEKGEFVGIRGPSGSGKSTLLYSLAGLLAPSAGEIFFCEKSIKKIHNKALYRRENIGFVFQDFYLYPRFTVLENMLFPCLHRFFVSAATVQKAAMLLGYLGIGEKKNVSVELLSAGERQRVCIARALLFEPQCILADEPTGNLDTENAKNILALLQKINEEHKTTILLVTHDEKVSDYAHRSITIVDGKLQNL